MKPEPSEWIRVGETGIRKGEWSIGKFKINDVWKYRVFKGDKRLGIYRTFDEARQEVESGTRTSRS